ncbi:hypothetical protein NONO_c17710 [Nocardia nova SH22a]|uniref:Uncharacterized protein n=1 Tax=Nocardia nova SH22a TaxID=1415166 RepID=W5TH49_9NOCA|nr:hypothetical protein [Nocardia nova]AHH16571.1 hypothetical protein NONO_c17710 [Nocardia nova SH22a]
MIDSEPWFARYERADARRKARQGLSIGWSQPGPTEPDATAQVYHLPAKPVEPEPVDTPPADYDTPPATDRAAPWYYRPAPEPPLWRAALEALGEIATAIFRRHR